MRTATGCSRRSSTASPTTAPQNAASPRAGASLRRLPSCAAACCATSTGCFNTLAAASRRIEAELRPQVRRLGGELRAAAAFGAGASGLDAGAARAHAAQGASSDFEPRILPDSVTVQALLERESLDHAQRVSFDIEGAAVGAAGSDRSSAAHAARPRDRRTTSAGRDDASGRSLMDPRLLELLQARAPAPARDGRPSSRASSRRSPGASALEGVRVRRSVRRAAAGRLRLPRRAGAAEDRRRVPAPSRSTCWRWSSRTTWRRCRRWRWSASSRTSTEGGAGGRDRDPARQRAARTTSRARASRRLRVPHRARGARCGRSSSPRPSTSPIAASSAARRCRIDRKVQAGGAACACARPRGCRSTSHRVWTALTCIPARRPPVSPRACTSSCSSAARRRPVLPATPKARWLHVARRRARSAASASRTSEALLPHGRRARSRATGCCTSTSRFPERFLFVELGGLAAGAGAVQGDRARDRDPARPRTTRARERWWTPRNFALYCTPAVNLFPMRADRIHLIDIAQRVPRRPDRTRPMDFEVYDVTEVVGFGDGRERRAARSQPLYAACDDARRRRRGAYYTLRREPRMLSAQASGAGARAPATSAARCSCRSSTPTDAPYARRPAAARGGDPVHQPRPAAASCRSAGATDFTLESAAPGRSASAAWRADGRRGRLVPAPTATAAWRLISHLSLNYLSLTDSDERQGAGGAARDAAPLRADRRAAGAQADRGRPLGRAWRPIVRRMPRPRAR